MIMSFLDLVHAIRKQFRRHCSFPPPKYAGRASGRCPIHAYHLVIFGVKNERDFLSCPLAFECGREGVSLYVKS